jgi:hypothetical protein
MQRYPSSTACNDAQRLPRLHIVNHESGLSNSDSSVCTFPGLLDELAEDGLREFTQLPLVYRERLVDLRSRPQAKASRRACHGRGVAVSDQSLHQPRRCALVYAEFTRDLLNRKPATLARDIGFHFDQ